MTDVAKYNTCKGISTALTFGTPIATMLAVGDFFTKRPATAVSGAAVFALLIVALFTKDKLAEKFKAPSALKLSLIAFGICALIRNIIDPIMYISGMTIIACGVDELTFKNLYKRIETSFPKKAEELKRFGFYPHTQATIDKLTEVKANES